MRAKAGSHGFVMVTVAIFLIVLLGFAALAIDVGMLYTSRTAAQRAVDAAALAGAFTFVASPTAIQPDVARSHALDVALASKIMGHSVLAGNVNVLVDVANRRVTVDIAHVEGSYFANVLGISSANIAVKAVAEASPVAIGSACAKPWFIPNTLLSSSQLCGTGSACAANEVMILPGGIVNQPFIDAFIAAHKNLPITIKPGNPQSALTPGQFYAVRLGDSTGGSDYRDNIAVCPGELVTCQKTYGVEPGNMIGPTNQGVLDLIGNPPDRFGGFDDKNVPIIIRPDNSTTNTSRSMVVAPIWDVCSMGAYCDSHDNFHLPDSGATLQIPVVGFALLFIEGVAGNDVLAHLLGVFPCGLMPVADDDVTGPYSVPVRLVRTS